MNEDTSIAVTVSTVVIALVVLLITIVVVLSGNKTERHIASVDAGLGQEQNEGRRGYHWVLPE